MKVNSSDTIVAVATGPGGALAVVRMSGPQAIAICDSVFEPATGKPLADSKSHTLRYGAIVDREGMENAVIDDILVSVFRSPHSYTGDNMVEISCHGSRYIQQEIVNLLVRRGARPAEAGEFTLRAFLAGRIDLSQAEAIADIIASDDRATHSMASNQMRGGYSAEFAALRGELLALASLLELELDFGEEDVEFADRKRLLDLADTIVGRIDMLICSFSLSNVIKEGVGVAIVGSPNVGKSTLLNALLHDDRAMVSDIAGTTRDVIEETVNIGGVKFRFTDTAGIRETSDSLEKMGIERTLRSAARANIILLMVEAGPSAEQTSNDIRAAIGNISVSPDQSLFIVINKTDKPGICAPGRDDIEAICKRLGGAVGESCIVAISAKTGKNIDCLLTLLSSCVDAEALYRGDTIVSNARHYEALVHARESLTRTTSGLRDNIPADLIAQNIREALYHLGTVTGEITTDEILQSIFSKFCIGK